ncbi:MAG: prolipoprotein diacylglyceryl transferase [Anaerolineales bacterium]
MDFTRTGIEIGPFELFGLTLNPTLHFYGLLIVIGIIAASTLAAWLAKRDDKDPEHVWNALIWAVVAGVIGARVWFVLFPPDASVEAGRDTAWMLSHPFDLNDGPLAIWNGGLGIFGAFIGGMLGVWLYFRQAKVKNIWSWLDIGAVVFPLGHAIGRWGNYVNQELYGEPTDLPWAISIDNPPLQYIDAAGFHPLFLYESLWNLLLCGFLVWLWMNYRTRLRTGDFVLIYLIGYSIVRFLLEFLRIETAHIPGTDINSSQATSILAIVISASWLFYRHRINRTEPTYHSDGRPVGKPKKQKSR